MIAILFKGIERGIFRKFMCIGVMIAMFFVLCGIVSATPCFPDTCIPNNDGCIGPSYPCTADANCSDDGWYCCGPKSTGNPLEETFYRDYFCNASSMCDYTITNAVDCDADDANWCEGDIRKNKDCTCEEGNLSVACNCTIIGWDCNADDGWVCRDDSSNIRDYRDYYCSGGACVYQVTGSEDCDDLDDGLHCWGNTVARKDYFCHVLVDECRYQLVPVENCDDKDGWYDTGETQWINDPTNECKEKEQKKQEYRDYYCDAGECKYPTPTDTRWIDTGNTRNKADGTTCSSSGTCENGECWEDGCCQLPEGCTSGYLIVTECTGSWYPGSICCTEGEHAGECIMPSLHIDGWYPDGANAEEYRVYFEGGCDYTVTDHRCNEGYKNCDGDWSNGCECSKECCGPGTTNALACYNPANPENGCCAYASCYDGTHPPDKCTTCYGGSWHSGWDCEGGECVPEASTLVLLATGLLFLVGYLGLRRKEN